MRRGVSSTQFRLKQCNNLLTCDAARPLLDLIPARINVERILIVENDRIALRNVSQFLSGEGYQVQRANNGDEALKLLEKEKFDLVLSDVIMPGTDGDRLLAHVRSRFADYPDNFNEWGTLLWHRLRYFFKEPTATFSNQSIWESCSRRLKILSTDSELYGICFP